MNSVGDVYCIILNKTFGIKTNKQKKDKKETKSPAIPDIDATVVAHVVCFQTKTCYCSIQLIGLGFGTIKVARYLASDFPRSKIISPVLINPP